VDAWGKPCAREAEGGRSAILKAQWRATQENRWRNERHQNEAWRRQRLTWRRAGRAGSPDMRFARWRKRSSRFSIVTYSFWLSNRRPTPPYSAWFKHVMLRPLPFRARKTITWFCIGTELASRVGARRRSFRRYLHRDRIRRSATGLESIRPGINGLQSVPWQHSVNTHSPARSGGAASWRA